MSKRNISESPPVRQCETSRHLLAQERAGLAGRIFIDGWRGLLLGVGGMLLVAAIGLLDYATGPELSFVIFYLIPIAIGAWYGGFAQGILISMACALSWQVVDVAEGSAAAPLIQLWNGTARFGVFVVTSSLLSRLRLSLYLEKQLARSDPLTGAANGRTFYESVSQSVERALRTGRPLSLAYFDLDNFKWLNDELGHSAGDDALCDLVGCIQRNIRITDLLARLGGDEFALLLPECDTGDAKLLLERIRITFTETMAGRKWPVTLSIGVMTFPKPLRDIDAMVRSVDDLMYRAKKGGKNRIAFATDESSDEAGADIERRATARALCNTPARIRAEGGEAGLDEFARVRDISANGLCLRLERRLPDQTLLAIEPLHECGAKTLLVRVIRSVCEDGHWLHGCVLRSRLKTDELQRWVTGTDPVLSRTEA